jgi:hypothetical protein
MNEAKQIGAKKSGKAEEPSTSEDVEMSEEDLPEKAPRRSKDEANAKKKAELDEGRMTLRGPHLQAVVAGEGGSVLTIGTGQFGQVIGHL